MEFQVVLERDDATRRYTATVPGLPIVVDAASKRAALTSARQAIRIYIEETRGQKPPSIHAELVTVKVDADAAWGS